jgi:tRNA1Val (adenine37-N6)-methyltransferase
MLAQQWSQASMTALEIDEAAAMQAAANFSASPFAHRLQVHSADARTWQPGRFFDVIVSNPPFHEQQLASPAAGRSMAHHSTQLSLQQLLACSTAWAHPGTQLYLLLPAYRQAEAEELAQAQGWHTAQAICLHPSDRKPAFRIMLQFCRQPAARQTMQFSIANADGHYQPPVLQWLQPYYLKL